MQAIVPHLWYDREAKEAADFYVSVLGGDSAITDVTTLHDTPSGDVDTVSFRLRGYDFVAISAGPHFKINPSISFLVPCATPFEVDTLWNGFIDGGTALMELGEYPFSQRYGWVQDRYGLSWQIIRNSAPDVNVEPIIPALLFVREVAGRAEEAINFYTSVFEDSSIVALHRYGTGHEHDAEDHVMYGEFKLNGQTFAAMDSGHPGHEFIFGEAISLMVNCENQDQIDYYWEKLSAVPEAEQCGWLKDQFGVSWQITPTEMNTMLTNGSEAQVAAVTDALLPMKKLEIAPLRQAYNASAS